ncbi:ATP-binding cassette domain-containing protein [Lautropia dentalis]|jgi:probable ATP-binding ABC transporter protein|uniref:ATP-binding cassette domain-containing protein n=1 Tax=Lautropia dentalis TaxID=2490857 RepID=A0A3R8MVC8_9BURK|nr:ATP-binding cassette domain-containing protein [Lautropia dentalis]RRN45951.1 ATP-binding cassette domain-containing protein [Lautropia dentalis]
MALIQVQNLTRRVPDSGRLLTILDDVSFTVQAGETVAIIGASGSGKSTLLGLLAGLDLPSSGDVQVDGQSLFARDEEQRARWRAEEVGFVFQSFQLLPAMTALENVMLPLELAAHPRARQTAEALLARVGLAERAGHYPRTLSGGEQQRVALARAFAVSPRLLFADEPTGSLDHATGERVIDLLFEMNRDFGATLILVTHDPRLAARCGRRLEIARGRLISQTDQSDSA